MVFGLYGGIHHQSFNAPFREYQAREMDKLLLVFKGSFPPFVRYQKVNVFIENKKKRHIGWRFFKGQWTVYGDPELKKSRWYSVLLQNWGLLITSR